MNGYEATRAIRQHELLTSVIALTVLADERRRRNLP